MNILFPHKVNLHFKRCANLNCDLEDCTHLKKSNRCNSLLIFVHWRFLEDRSEEVSLLFPTRSGLLVHYRFLLYSLQACMKQWVKLLIFFAFETDTSCPWRFYQTIRNEEVRSLFPTRSEFTLPNDKWVHWRFLAWSCDCNCLSFLLLKQILSVLEGSRQERNKLIYSFEQRWIWKGDLNSKCNLEDYTDSQKLYMTNICALN